MIHTAVEEMLAASQTDQPRHVACCDDDDLALCGEERNGRPLMDAGTEVTCDVCSRLEDEDCCPVSALLALKRGAS